MFQATRRRLALWYTGVTAVLLLLFATGFYLYVRSTLVERIDDTLNHVVEVVQRSLVIEPVLSSVNKTAQPLLHVDLAASFPSNADAVEDDHIDLEWFSPTGELLWSTFSTPIDIPVHPNNNGETVYGRIKENDDRSNSVIIPYPSTFALRQITQKVQIGDQILGYLRVSHPWFEVTKPSRQLIRDLSLGVILVLGAVAAIGWFLSGLAIAPVRDSYQRLKQFTADASHELRNPIAVIQTNVQVALADPDPSLQQDQLHVIERLTRRLGRLVDNLLFLARQDSGMTELQISSVQLDRLLQEVMEEQQAMAVEKQITLLFHRLDPATEASGELGDGKSREKSQERSFPSSYTITADADQITRLFTNLISNAVQYTPTAGIVEVKLERVKSQGSFHLQVQVQDSGIGIPPESLPHIFDRFYRADPARPSRTASQNGRSTLTGSGLGLAIAKVIVENHQGQIQVSSSPNQGTTFTVLLPCSKNAVSTHPNGSSASSLHGK